MDDELIRSAQIRQIKNAVKYKKALYFCAHTGWGKTTVMKQYFAEYGLPYHYISCCDEDFCESLADKSTKDNVNIVIDDIQDAQDCETDIVKAISESNADTKFYILGRCSVPQYLKPFLITGQMLNFSCDFFAFSTEEIKTLFLNNGKNLSAAQTEKLQKTTQGWFLGISAFMLNFSEDKTFDEIINLGILDIFEYFNERLFDSFDEDIKSFLLHIGPLAEFTEEQAQMVCGQKDVKAQLKKILSMGSFFTFEPPNKFVMQPLFHRYLIHKQKTECSKEFRIRCYESAALYYALKNDITNALKYYRLAGNDEKVAELLLKNAENHAGNGYFYEVREHYFSLPEHIVKASPELMSTLSMIYSISCSPEKSEKYFSMLEAFEKETPDKSKKKAAQEKLASLKIALPHRGVHKMEDIFKSYMPLVLAKKLTVQDMSITGNMPSLMNGGKDFCEWSKRDRTLYKALKIPITCVLGKHCGGLVEIGLGESLFEKNTDGNFTEELTLLNSGYYEAEASGSVQLMFASLAVMARIYATTGKADTAADVIKKFRARVEPKEEILRNIDAFLAYLSMLMGNQNEVNTWFLSRAPDENSGFCIMDRYRYLTKVKVYLIKERYNEALSLLSRADKYFTEYERTYCHIEALILKAIVLYRMKDEAYNDIFVQALELCGEYQFVRLVSKYGIAVLDMLKETDADISKEYLESLIQNTQRQAVLYPKYLKPEKKADYNLTDSERTVLKLICDGLSNEEIAKLTGTTVRTVKFHLGNIYTKLNVKGRAGAINLCLENEIV